MLFELVSLFAFAASAAVPHEIDDALAAKAQAHAVFQRITQTALNSETSFRASERLVSNWRVEAARRLDSTPQSLAKLVADAPAATPRCIKLNNYWCVKRAGWAGELAADADGHVAFASAMEGAVVAVMLLRRYYLVYDRRSAQAIVSRWAPAQCVGAGASAEIGLGALAPRGIANTLRARWLASHRLGSAARQALKAGGQTPKPKRSIVADRPIQLMAAPEIAVGMGERPAIGMTAEKAALRLAVALMIPIPPSLSGSPCSGDTARIRQYALRAVDGIGVGPDDDLLLFAPDGTPGPNLPLVMQNMAKVEIGPFGARSDLIAGAIAAETQQEAARRTGEAQDTATRK